MAAQNPRHPMTLDEKVKDVLNCLSGNRLSLIEFLEAYFASQCHSIASSRGKFFASRGMPRIFKAMLENSEYALDKRATAKRTKQLYEDFGPYFNTIIVRMLRVEVNEVSKDPHMHMKPIDVSPQNCEEFDLREYESLYKEKAPILFGIIQVLCCVPSAMSIIRDQNIGEPLLDVELADELEDIDPEGDLDDPDDLRDVDSDQGGPGKQKARKKRRTRSKNLMSVMCMSIMMTARSLHNNAISVCISITVIS
jgi:hypothetical protein